MNLSERIAHMATNPYIAPVLLTIGICWDYTEILTPGFASEYWSYSFGLFFGGNFIVGAAQSWVLGLFILGCYFGDRDVYSGFGVFGVAVIYQ